MRKTKVRGFAPSTFQYLTFTKVGRHPVVRSSSCSFLSVRLPKLQSLKGNSFFFDAQKAAYLEAVSK